MDQTKPAWLDIRVGDIITTYHKGYWRLTRIEVRVNPHTPLFYYEKVMDADCQPVKKKPAKQCCDASYCTKISKAKVREMKQAYIEKLNRLLEVLSE